MKENFKKKWEFLTKENRPFKTRLLISLAVHAFAVLTAYFLPSLEVYLKSVGDFDFAFSSLLSVMGIASVIIFAVGIGFSLFLKGRLLNYYLTAVFSAALCAYLQGTFLNSGLPSLDGTAVQWHYLKAPALINLAIWIVVFLVPFVIHFFSRKVWKKAVVYLSCLLIVMNAASTVSLLFGANLTKSQSKGYYSREGLYESSDEGDVVVFLLDYYDNDFMDKDLAAYPDLLDEWTGFTRFTNCSGMYKQTIPSIPYLLTGIKWYCETPVSHFAPIAFQESEFMSRIKNTGADINLYVSGTANAKEAYDAADNYKYKDISVNQFGMFKAMTKHLFYRNMPTIAKSVFWHYTDDISNASLSSNNGEELTAADKTYTIDDARLFREFEQNGLTAADNKTFKFIHMMGAHYPHTLDENGRVSANTTDMKQRRGVVHIVSEYLAAMKEMGTYDNSTIIIIADHGFVEVANEMSQAVNPILFVKPAGADSSAPVKTSAAPVSQEDFHPTVLWALGDENYSDLGRTFFEIEENEQRKRYFYFRVAFDGSSDESLIEYEINGDVSDFNNWKKTGNVWGTLAK